jgi:hypothetical protein
MAFVLLFATLGFSVDLHYCKGQLKSFSFIGKAASCHANQASCPNHSKTGLKQEAKEENCCSNKKIQKDNMDEDYTMSSVIELTNIPIHFAATYSFVVHEPCSLPSVEHSIFPENKDLLPPRDIYVLLESFLL